MNKICNYPLDHPIGNLVHIGLGYGTGFISSESKLASAAVMLGFLLYEYSRVKSDRDKLIAVGEFTAGMWLGTSVQNSNKGGTSKK